MKPDLLIVGGGPGGGLSALLAARRGMRVQLIERKRFPRDKVCGEVFSSTAREVLQRAELLEPLFERGALPLDGCSFGDQRGRGFVGALNGLSLSRAAFDLFLKERAIEAGVDWIEGRSAGQPILDGGRVVAIEVRAEGGHSAARFTAERFVAADGRRSRLAHHLKLPGGDPQRTRPASRFGLKCHLVGVEGLPRGRVAMHLFPGGYAGLSEIEEGRWNLCMQIDAATLKAQRDPERILDKILRCHLALGKQLRNAKRCSRWHSIGPLRYGSRAAFAAGVYFVGDAAGTIDPFCGLGIGRALRSAELAVQSLVQDDAGRRYRQAWEHELGRQALRNRRFGALIERPAIGNWAIGAIGARFPQLGQRCLQASWR